MIAVLWVALLIAVSAAGWFAGMWMGERGRRKDLQYMMGKEERPTTQPTTTTRMEPHPDEAAFNAAEVSEVADHLLIEAQKDGNPISEEQAVREAQRLLHEGQARAGRAV